MLKILPTLNFEETRNQSRFGRKNNRLIGRLQEADFADGRHDLPFDQAAADDVVCGRPSDRDAEERHPVGRVGAPAQGPAGNGLG